MFLMPLNSHLIHHATLTSFSMPSTQIDGTDSLVHGGLEETGCRPLKYKFHRITRK